jgi:hypothetical protein
MDGGGLSLACCGPYPPLLFRSLEMVSLEMVGDPFEEYGEEADS